MEDPDRLQTSKVPSEPRSPNASDEEILHYPLMSFSAGTGWTPEVIVTRSRITVGLDTLSLAGAERVTFEVVRLGFRSGRKKRRRGLFLGGFLILPGILAMAFGHLIAGTVCVAIGLGHIFAGYRTALETAQVWLHKRGKRQVVYSDEIGSPFLGDWAKYDYLNDEEMKVRMAEYEVRRKRAESIAAALGTAIGQAASPQ